MKLLRKSYFYFWLAPFYVVLTNYIINSRIENSVINFNIHDTYFIIDETHAVALISAFLLSIGIIYYLFEKINIRLASVFTLTHTFITLVCILIYPIGKLYYQLSNDFPLFDSQNSMDTMTITLIGILVLAQFLFILNVILSTTRHYSKRKKT